MKYGRAGLLVCAVVMSALHGCDTGAEQGGNEATSTSCAVLQYGSPWWNQAFPDQTGMFHVEFAADVTSANMDGVIGLSNGAADYWTDLAAIVRFNTQGTIDARDGSTYRADRVYTYYANQRYYFRFDVDLAARRYSVWFKTSEFGQYEPIARDYSFRTEQLSVTHLDNVGAYVNPETSTQGALEACGFTAITDNTTADGCMVSSAGSGFSNAVVDPATHEAFVSFAATPGQANMDGVIGVGSGDVDWWDDYAVSVRFWTNGYIEARDGDQYRADRAIAYVPGKAYRFRVFADLNTHTYSVYVTGPNTDPNSIDGYVQLASGYRFRPTQAQVGALDRIATVVASDTGRLDACELTGGPHGNVVAVRDGNFQVVPLADGGALLENPQRTMRLDANNRLVWAFAGTGRIAADSTGNFYMAISSAGNQSVVVQSETLSLSPRWSREWATNGPIADAVATEAGELVLVIGDSAPQSYMRLSASTGELIATHALPSGTVAFGLAPTQFAVARGVDSGYVFETYTYSDPVHPIRSRQIDGNYWVYKIAVAPDGSFVIAGALGGPMNFGDGAIEPYGGPADSGVYWDSYIAAFAPDFTTRFSRRLTNDVSGLVTNGGEIAVAYLTWTQLHYTDYRVFDPYGNVLRGSSEDSFVSGSGFPGTIALADSGRIYFNLTASLGAPFGTHFPFLVTLEP